MQAAAGKNAQTYQAVMDAIRSRLGVETLVSSRVLLVPIVLPLPLSLPWQTDIQIVSSS